MKSALCSPCRIRIQALLLPRAHAGSHCGENSAAVTPLSTSHPAHSSLTPGKQLGSPCWRAQTQEREENLSTFDASTGFGNFWLKEDRVSQLREAPQVLTSDLLPVVQAAVMLTALPRQEHGAQLFQGFPAHPIPLGKLRDLSHWWPSTAAERSPKIIFNFCHQMLFDQGLFKPHTDSHGMIC